MIVQVYNDGPARLFPTRRLTMLCELNGTTRQEADAILRDLRIRRRTAWERTEWGWQAKCRFAPTRLNACKSEGEKP